MHAVSQYSASVQYAYVKAGIVFIRIACVPTGGDVIAVANVDSPYRPSEQVRAFADTSTAAAAGQSVADYITAGGTIQTRCLNSSNTAEIILTLSYPLAG